MIGDFIHHNYAEDINLCCPEGEIYTLISSGTPVGIRNARKFTMRNVAEPSTLTAAPESQSQAEIWFSKKCNACI